MLPSRITTFLTDNFYSLLYPVNSINTSCSTALHLLCFTRHDKESSSFVHSMQNVVVLVLLLYFWSAQLPCKKEVVDGRRSQLLSNNKLCSVSATEFQLLFPKPEASAIFCDLSRLSWNRISFTAPSWHAAWRLCSSLTAPLAPSPGSLKSLTSGHSISIR